MRRYIISSCMTVSALLFALLLGGCGSSNKEGAQDQLASATPVGSASCRNCHEASPDITGNPIGATWAASTHATVQGVQCENCHGNGSLHWGLGPIPFPNPQADRCAQALCHSTIDGGAAGAALAEFNATRHANTNLIPDKTFSQFDPSGGATSSGRHIEECSRCHNVNQRFQFDFAGNLVEPSPGKLPKPVVTCASCHDGHQPQQMQAIPQRTAPVGYPIFRKFVTDATGAQVNADAPGAQNVAAFIFQPNGAAIGGTVSGINNEINPERLCAACHTKGVYKNSGGATHQGDIYSQWTNSGHGDRTAAAFGEFSANPAAYGFAVPTGHETTYPFDMALKTAGATASTTQNQGSNNYACFKCHNGVASLAWQANVQGTSAAPVVFGDATVTCLTCHNPHANVAGQTKNTRRPVVMTNYSTTSARIVGNFFLDGQTVPITTPNAFGNTTGNGTICIFCHQGRESGFTLYKTKLAPGKSAAGNFFNPHYLGTGAMLWGANGYEYTGKSYSVNAAHQGANCPTCHMANATADNLNGGHSWRPNVATCNAVACHGSVGPAVAAIGTTNSPDVAAYRATFDTNDYDGDGNSTESIAAEIQGLQDRLIALLAANGIFYSDLNYPYFFSDAGFTTPFATWNTATGGTSALKAAFNLQFAVKGLPSAATSQTLVPNASAAVHNYKYIIQLLRDSYDDYNAVAAVPGAALGGVRPVGTRAATVYGPGQ